MRKVYILFFTVIGMILGSCTSDSDSPSNKELLIGKWAFSETGSLINGEEIMQDYGHNPSCSKDNFEFFADGTFKRSSYYDPASCTVTAQEGTWSVEGDDLTMNFQSPIIFHIETLSDATLKMTTSYDFQGQTMTDIDIFTKE